MNTRLIQKYPVYIYEIFLFVVLLVMATRASVIVTTNNTLQGTIFECADFLPRVELFVPECDRLDDSRSQS